VAGPEPYSTAQWVRLVPATSLDQESDVLPFGCRAISKGCNYNTKVMERRVLVKDFSHKIALFVILIIIIAN